ncbi:MAG: sulfate reduction electron transfer complex DsrMKJOP subunit DsrO [Candidatus Thiodiazotropha endolucinida]
MPADTKGTNKDRRGVLTGAIATILGAPVFGVFLSRPSAAKRPEAPASARNRWGLLIDTERCAKGCDACVRACFEENGIQSHGRPRTDPQWIRKVTVRENLSGRITSLPLMCQHCTYPPCVDVCPTGASFRRADGIVLVDRHTCIGCRYCMMACPYEVRFFVHEDVVDQKTDVPRGKGTAEGCTLCVHRVDRDRTPACAEACNKEGHKAILFGDINDVESEISKRLRDIPSAQLRADLKLDTSVRYTAF